MFEQLVKCQHDFVKFQKSELLLLNPSRKPSSFEFKVKINGRKLYPSDTVKYLGVIFDSSLNGVPISIQFVRNCLGQSRANGMLSKIRYYVSRDVLLSLYYALFHSHLSYATNVWALNANSTKRILNLQKKAVRLMTFSDFDAHSLPLFTQLRMLSFHDFTKLTNIIFIFNLLNYNLPAPLYDIFHLHDMTHLNLRRSRRAKNWSLTLT